MLQEYIGPLGLVVANCFAMSIRISYTLCYIRFIRFSWTSEAFLPAIMPRKRLLLLMCGTCALTIVTSKIHTAIHIFSGALTLLITLMALLKLERSSLMTIRQSTKKVGHRKCEFGICIFSPGVNRLPTQQGCCRNSWSSNPQSANWPRATLVSPSPPRESDPRHGTLSAPVCDHSNAKGSVKKRRLKF